MGSISVHPHIPCVNMFGTVQYSSVHTIPTVGQYTGTDR